MSSEQIDVVTPELLAPMVEQPEASVNGDWYLVSLEQLAAEGYTHIEIHFRDDADRPNAAQLIKYDPAGSA